MLEKDRWNLAKFKVLRTLTRLGDANSIMLAERTRKTINTTDTILKGLLEYKHIKIIPYTKSNNGCCNRFTLTQKGRNYLLALQTRFLQGNDLNLKYFPRPVDYKESDMEWARREFVPHDLECTGELRDLKVSRTTQDNITCGAVKDIRLITSEEKPYAKGDFFEFFNMKYLIFHVESFTINSYAEIFSQYSKPKNPAAFKLKLQQKHPGAAFVYLLYFKRYKEEKSFNLNPSSLPTTSLQTIIGKVSSSAFNSSLT